MSTRKGPYLSAVPFIQSHLSRAVRCWGQPTTENSLSPEREEGATIHAASVLPHHLSGTIYRDTSKRMTLVVNNSLAIWWHFCLHGPVRERRLWERLFKRRSIDGLTYLPVHTHTPSHMHCYTDVVVACCVCCMDFADMKLNHWFLFYPVHEISGFTGNVTGLVIMTAGRMNEWVFAIYLLI